MTTGSPEAPLLSLDRLSVAYRVRSATTHAVRGVSLSIARAETVAIVGESGSGKSTTAHAIIGLLAENGFIEGGTITFDGEDITRLSGKSFTRFRGARIGLVPQDPGVALNPVHRVGDQIAEVFRLHGGLGRGLARERAVAVLADAGIDNPERRAQQYPHELSGGMRQRALIGIAIAANPELIIADEPTSALDATVQRQVLDLLENLTRQRGTALLLITHNLALAAERADRIVVMRSGTVVEEGSAQDIRTRPAAPYTRELIEAVPGMSARRLRSSHGRGPAASGPGAPEPAAPAPASGPGAPEPAARAEPGPVIAVDGLVKTFRRGATRHRAVDGASFTVRRGETLAIVGESGSGKSTTARIITRFTRPDAGSVTVLGEDVTRLRAGRLRALRRRIQLVYQNPYSSLDPRHTVGEIIAEPLRAFGIASRQDRPEIVRRLLADVLLPADTARRHPRELSGGQRQRVAIARALAPDPEILVLDEPVSSLDVSVQSRVLQLLTDLQAEHGLTYLFITHDLAVVRQIADDVAVMKEGRIVETGTVDQVFTSPQEEYTAALLAAIPDINRRHATEQAQDVPAL
jgi:peptide/nickel transport system ATP-binding protein